MLEGGKKALVLLGKAQLDFAFEATSADLLPC